MSTSNEKPTMAIENMFPLYDLLKSKVVLSEHDKELSNEEIRVLRERISMLDPVGRDIVFIIIRLHCLRNTNSRILDIPYQGEKIASNNETGNIDAKFDIRNFPPLLSRMLYVFAELHIRKLNEDQTHIE